MAENRKTWIRARSSKVLKSALFERTSLEVLELAAAENGTKVGVLLREAVIFLAQQKLVQMVISRLRVEKLSSAQKTKLGELHRAWGDGAILADAEKFVEIVVEELSAENAA